MSCEQITDNSAKVLQIQQSMQKFTDGCVKIKVRGLTVLSTGKQTQKEPSEPGKTIHQITAHEKVSKLLC